MPVPSPSLDGMLDAKIRRRLALVIALLFALIAFVISWSPGIDPAAASWISGSLFKLSIMVGAIWLAFPQMEAVRRMRGGGTILTGLLVLAAVLIVRPRLLVYFVPIVVTSVAILVSLGWIGKGPKRRTS